ncbi:hypothetical protein IWX49DRAFT_189340 [Phyllosticta citricarpa]|uniref:Uncharacterized protein n=1 Tax=Phyllosticta citricarpa TaxID=55181 RepID=A0ABR1LYQ4_9PEZI
MLTVCILHSMLSVHPHPTSLPRQSTTFARSQLTPNTTSHVLDSSARTTLAPLPGSPLNFSLLSCLSAFLAPRSSWTLAESAHRPCSASASQPIIISSSMYQRTQAACETTIRQGDDATGLEQKKGRRHKAISGRDPALRNGLVPGPYSLTTAAARSVRRMAVPVADRLSGPKPWAFSLTGAEL